MLNALHIAVNQTINIVIVHNYLVYELVLTHKLQRGLAILYFETSHPFFITSPKIDVKSNISREICRYFSEFRTTKKPAQGGLHNLIILCVRRIGFICVFLFIRFSVIFFTVVFFFIICVTFFVFFWSCFVLFRSSTIFVFFS